jgi:transcriptional regulator with GAF, ATPase, and Fis domain
MSPQRSELREPIAGRYRILEAFREDGRLGVYLVEDRRDADSRKVLKLFEPGPSTETARSEIEALRGLSHPNLTRVLDAGVENGRLFLVRDYMEGGDLSSRTPLSREDAVAVVVELARALGFLHARGIVHLDLKPANVLSARAGELFPVRLSDFGLATRMGEGARGGTPYFAPPEVIAGLDVDGRADLFSLGVLLAYLLGGPPPVAPEEFYRRFPASEFLEAAGYDPASLPSDLADFIRALTRWERSLRPARASEVIRALNRGRRKPFPVETPETAVGALAVDPLAFAQTAVRDTQGWIEGLLRDSKAKGGALLLGERGGSARPLALELAARAALRGIEVVRVEGAEARRPRDLLERAGLPLPALSTPTAAGTLDFLESAAGGGGDEAERAARALCEAKPPSRRLLLFLDFEDAEESCRRAVLSAMGRTGPDLLLVAALDVSAVPSGEAGAWRARRSRPQVRVFSLAPMRPAEVQAFLEGLLGATAEPTRIAEAAAVLHESTRGNPSRFSEALRSLFEKGILRFAEEGFVLRPFDAQDAAVGDARSVLERADRTADGAGRLLRVLAGLGGSADPALLAEALGESIERGAASIAALREKGWVSGPGPDGTLRLRSDLRRTLAEFESLEPETASRAADALRRRGASLDRIAPLLLEAGRAEEGVRLALKAAGELREQGATRGAIRLLSRALPLAAEREPSVRLALAETRLSIGDLSGTVETLAPLRESEACAPAVRAAALRSIAEASALLGRLDEALEALRQGRALQVESSPEDERRWARDEAFVRMQRGDFREAIRTLEEALARIPPGRGRERLRIDAGAAYLRGGDLDAAQPAFETALARLREMADEEGVGIALLNLGILRNRRGDSRESVALLREARSLFDRVGRPSLASYVAHHLGIALKDMGDFAQARPPLLEALSTREALGDAYGETASRASLGILETERGDAVAGLGHLDAALRVFRSLGSRREETMTRNRRAFALLELDRMAEAREEFRAALEEAESLGLESERAEALAGLALRALVAGEDAETEASILQAEEAAKRSGDRRARSRVARASIRIALGRARADLALARIAELRGSPEGANAEATGELDLLEGQAREIAGETSRALERFEAAADRAGRAGSLTTRARACASAAHLLAQAGDFASFRAHRAAAEEAIASLGPESGARRRILGGALDARLARAEEAAQEDAAKSEARTGLSLEAMRTVLALNKRMIGGARREDLLHFLLESAVSLTGARRGFLLLLRGEAIEFEGATSLDRGDISAPARELSHSIVKRAFESGRAILTTNARSDPSLSDLPSVEDLDLRSVACVPFRAEEGIEGALYVDNPIREGAFTDRTIELLDALADQAAMALATLRRQEEIERLHEELRGRLRHRDAALAVAERELREIRGRLPSPTILGKSQAIRDVLAFVERVGPTDIPVLIEGEPGTGKELVAREIHRQSRRASRPFVSENCAAIPATLLESAFFGHVRGAFTGADRDQVGLFEAADGGTLFLDEIGEMPLELQAKLLRAIELKEIRPVGARDVRSVDVRIVAATNRDLAARVGEGAFREDLYYRLRVAPMRVPALAERMEDVPLLVEHFLARLNEKEGAAKTLSPAVLDRLRRRVWPGNVRELENEVTRLFHLSGDHLDDPSLVSEPAPRQPTGDALVTAVRPMDEIEAAAIRLALRETAGNKDEAARRLGIARATIYAKIKKYGIET